MKFMNRSSKQVNSVAEVKGVAHIMLVLNILMFTATTIAAYYDVVHAIFGIK